MKTVHSQVLSSDPISLSDATSFLSAFNTSVCGGGGRASVGASPETCWFVRRALVSFEELEQLHHKLNDRKPRSKTHNDDAKTTVGDNPSQSVATSRDVTSNPRSSHPHDDVISRRVEVEEQSEGGEVAEIDDNKKKKKKEKKKSIIGNIGENGGGIEEGDGESDMVKKEKEKEKKKKKKKKKKKRDNVHENPGEIKEEEDGESEMKSEEVNREEKKKKKKRKSEVLESGEVDASEEQQQQEKRKKKRKSEVLESGKVDASEEQQEKRKKRKS